MSPGYRELARSRPHPQRSQVRIQILLYLLLALSFVVPLASISLERESDISESRHAASQLINDGLFRATREVLQQTSAYRLAAMNHQKQFEQLLLVGAGREQITDHLQGLLAAAEPPLAAILYATPQMQIKALGGALAYSQPAADELLVETYHSTGPDTELPAAGVQPLDMVRLPQLSREDGSPLYAARLSLALETRNQEPARLTLLMDQRDLLAPLATFVESLHHSGAAGARLYLRNGGGPDESAWTILCMPRCRVQAETRNSALSKLIGDRPDRLDSDNNQQWQVEDQVVFAQNLSALFPFYKPDRAPDREVLISLPNEQLAALLGDPPTEQHRKLFQLLIALALLMPLLVLTVLRDLLRRARQQANLAAYETIVQGSPNGILLVDTNGVIVTVNDSICELSGYPQDELIGQHVELLVPEAHRGNDVELRHVGQREPTDRALNIGDRALQTATGQEIEVAMTLAKVLINDQPHTLILIRDVRKEHAAAEERERLTLVAEHTHDHVIITNHEGQIIWANAAYFNFVGANVEQLKGQSVFDRLHAAGADEQAIQRLKNACQNRQNKTVDAEVGGTSGRRAWIEIANIPTEHYMVFVARDVTARYLAAEERERLTLVAEHTNDMVIITDLELRSVWANPALGHFTGTDPEQLKGPLVTDLLKKMANADQEAVQKIEEACRTRQAAAIETPINDQAGRRFWIEIAIKPVEKYLVLVSRDVTARHRAAEQLAESNRQLERRVSERTRELTLAKEQAETANRAKSAFLATMSHEIRTPLHGVIASVDLMEQQQMDNILRKHLRRIEQSADNLASILNGVLDFSRIESGQLELEHDPLMLRNLLEDTVGALHLLAREKGVQLMVNVDPDLDASAVYGDSARLTQVVNNLLGNAIKFSAGQSQPLVLLRALLVDQRDSQLAVVLEVTDNGIGMTEAQAEKIFEPFAQAQSDITRRYGGTGLGLSITQVLVKAMDGDIKVASAPGNGSTFTVNLRLPTCVEITPPSYPSLSAARLLVLPPESSELQEIVLSYLGSAGAEVEWCEHQSLQALDEQISTAAGLGHPYQAVLVCNLSSSLLTPLVEAAAGSAYPPLLFLDNGDVEPGDLPGGTIQQPIMRLALLEQIAATLGQTAVARQSKSEPGLAKGKGELILVVEDNPLNRELFAEQVQLLGYRCVIAVDGVHALQEFENQEFSAVLTDCHMPQMDGYQLTREIRRREGEMAGSPHLPIIAVTADITAEERRRCSRAGMDEWLAKPVVLSDIAGVLARWVTAAPVPTADAGRARLPQSEGGAQIASRPVVPANPPEVPASSTSANGTSDQPPLNIEVLAEMVGDDFKVQQRFINKFLHSAPPIVAAMIAAAEVGDAAVAAKQAHKLKSSARAVGAYQLATTCEALEAAGKAGVAGKTANLNPLAAEVRLALDRAQQYAATEYPLLGGDGEDG